MENDSVHYVQAKKEEQNTCQHFGVGVLKWPRDELVLDFFLGGS